MVGNFGHELHALPFRSMIDAALKNATAVSVGGDFHAASSHRIVYELVVFRLEVVEAFLYDYSSLLVTGIMSDNKKEYEPWLPFRSLIRVTTCMLRALISA